jgi:hypothetical protein
MIETKLQTVEGLVDQLNVDDQVRLLQYLAPRIAGAVLRRTESAGASDEAWRRFRRIGEKLASTSTPGANSLTQALSDMRRK